MNKIISYDLSEDFIENVSNFLCENFVDKKHNFDRVAIVFGGKRPFLFLKREISRKIGSAFFPPKCFSIDEFMDYILSKQDSFSNIQDMDACFIVYNLAKKLMPDMLKTRGEFWEFLPWAREIISLIEQFDLENVDVKNLHLIEKNATIGYDVPEIINSMFENIVKLRDAYHLELKAQKKYSRGLKYLRASEIIDTESFKEFDHIIFCNFFDMHLTEKKVMKSVYDKDKAILFFHGDDKKWSVLKELADYLKSEIRPSKDVNPKYSLNIYSGFDSHSQVALVKKILKDLKDIENTVVVLPNPDNLIPLLSEITSLTDEFNISMGYPLVRSSIYSLFECIFKVYETKKENLFYCKDYLNLLGHPLLKNIKICKDSLVTRIVIHKIEEAVLGIYPSDLSGLLFIGPNSIMSSDSLIKETIKTLRSVDIEVSRTEVQDVICFIHENFLCCWNGIKNFEDFSNVLEKFSSILLKESFLGVYPLNLKIMEKVLDIEDEFRNASFKNEPFELSAIFKIFANKLAREVISFLGSPLKGLQVLGFFETRSLNFKNVIILDMNEGFLPRLDIYKPLIPSDVMSTLGLNRISHQEQTQRYQFLRLISSAKNVHLVYEESDQKQRSRFLEELIWSAQIDSGKISTANIQKISFKNSITSQEHTIEKSNDVIRFLKEDFEYSPSSINTYVQCPLKFYYQYVLRLSPKEEFLEEPQAEHIGSFIHNFLEDIFKKYLDTKPDMLEDFKKYFFRSLDSGFKEYFEKRMKNDALLLKEIIKIRMEAFLEKESSREYEKILMLEHSFRGSISLNSHNLKFVAKIDRIDKLNDKEVLVLDYKTGSYDPMPKSFDKITDTRFDRTSINENIKSFQLPLYVYFASKFYPQYSVNAGLYNLRTAEIKYFSKTSSRPKLEVESCEDMVPKYMEYLACITDEILNPGVCFKKDDSDVFICKMCPFFYLCK